MKNLILITTFNLICFLPLFGQSEYDYEIINKLIEHDRISLTEDSIYFITDPKLNSREFGGGKRKIKELIAWYSSSINRLIKDTLPQYQERINNREIKKSFVNWDNKKIQHNFLTKKTYKENFFYLSKPIHLNNELFVLIDIGDGGISVKLYSFINNEIKELKTKTIRRVGIKFRTRCAKSSFRLST